MAAIHFIDGDWVEGNPPILGPLDHAAWLGSTVFDGGRAFDGTTPDLDLHCSRVIGSARSMGLKPMYSGDEILEIAMDGIALLLHGLVIGLLVAVLFFGREVGGNRSWLDLGFAGLRTATNCLPTLNLPTPNLLGPAA